VATACCSFPPVIVFTLLLLTLVDQTRRQRFSLAQWSGRRYHREFPMEQRCRVLDAHLPACETNSAGPGSNVWGGGANTAPSRWRSDSGPRDGRHSFRQRYPLASGRGRARQVAGPRALRFSATKASRNRGSNPRGRPRGPGTAPLGAAERQKEPRRKFSERNEPPRASFRVRAGIPPGIRCVPQEGLRIFQRAALLRYPKRLINGTQTRWQTLS